MLSLVRFCGGIGLLVALLPAATLSGIITDVPGALVIVQSAEDGQELARLTTDVSGAYQSLSLSPGHYRLRIEAAGFERMEVRGIHVQEASLSLPPISLMPGNMCGYGPGVRYLEPLSESSNVRSQITGSVVDSKRGRPLSKASGVALLCQRGSECVSLPLSARGDFSWNVLPGTYRLKIRCTGYFAEEDLMVEAQAGFHTVYSPVSLYRCRGRCRPSQKPPMVCE